MIPPARFPPLDFVAATDHGAYMGVLPAMDTPGTALNALPMAKDMFSNDPDKIVAVFRKIGTSVRTGKPLPGAYDKQIVARTWRSAVDAADRYYRPGKLTTFAAYEYTAVVTRPDSEDFGTIPMSATARCSTA